MTRPLRLCNIKRLHMSSLNMVFLLTAQVTVATFCLSLNLAPSSSSEGCLIPLLWCAWSFDRHAGLIIKSCEPFVSCTCNHHHTLRGRKTLIYTVSMLTCKIMQVVVIGHTQHTHTTSCGLSTYLGQFTMSRHTFWVETRFSCHSTLCL